MRSPLPVPPPLSRPRWPFAVAAGALLLLGQHLLLFFRHYFRDHVFPDDFLLTYHAVPAYWIEALARGEDIAWIPVQAMGYPLYMALQSGFAYLPLRLFAWFGEPYSVPAAVVLQGLHVLVGAIGAVVCSRLVGSRWRTALLAGVLYQAFGGFYSNAQHPDIVRSFAFLPWLCAPVLADWRGGRLLAVATLALPFWIYSQFTGGYPGAAIASTLLLGGLTLARLALEPGTRRTGALVLAAQAAGVLLAGWAILPAGLDGRMIDRTAELGSLEYDYLQLRDALALAFPVDGSFFAHDVSMRSLFLALPGLALVLAAAGRLRELPRWPLWCALLALLLAAGPLHQLLRAIVPPAGLSRFVMADYRGFVVLGLVLAGVHWLDLPAADAPKWRLWPLALAGLLLAGVHLLGLARPHSAQDRVAQLMLVAVAAACSWPRWQVRPAHARRVLGALALLAGMLLLYQLRSPGPFRNAQVVMLCVLAGAAMLALTQAPLRQHWPLALLTLALLTTADWGRVHQGQRYFAPPVQDGVPWLEASIGPFQAARASLAQRLDANACRGTRRDPPPGPARWAGYYTGEPHLQDHGIKLVPHKKILADEHLREFARQSWRMVALPPADGAAQARMLAAAPAVAGVSCASADSAAATYLVDLPAPQRVVENEVHWPGWSATLACRSGCEAGRTLRIEPESALGFRSWSLPAGQWEMKVRFVAPHRAAGWAATGVGVVLWVLLGVMLWRAERMVNCPAPCRTPRFHAR